MFPNGGKNNTSARGWLWNMAWRDSRTHRRRLLLFVMAIVMGIAALVGIDSFSVNLHRTIDDQAKNLLGADLLISGLRPFPPEIQAVFDSLGGEQADERVFASMAYFPQRAGTRLVQIRALAGSYPFYGDIVTKPPQAASQYLSGNYALLDNALMQQFRLSVGDSVRVGAASYAIAGTIVQIPSEPPVASTFNPRIYLPLRSVDSSLLRRGSLVSYRKYFKFEPGTNLEAAMRGLGPYLDRYRLRADTIEKRKQALGDIMDNLYRFLNLVGFIALILGSIGVASAVHIYMKQKLNDVAVLRCFGARSREAFAIYLIQIAGMAVAGSFLGTLLGVGLQFVLPAVFSEFLPVRLHATFAWFPAAKGFSTGVVMALLFALLPTLPLRNVSPLFALRANFNGRVTPGKERLRLIVMLAIVAILILFALAQTRSWTVGLSFIAAVAAAFGVITLTSKVLMFLVRRFFPHRWPYVFRQGLANLYRPNNQTWMLMLSIGLGTFLITTLFLVHQTLLSKVAYVGAESRPNLVLFDIQPDQKDGLAQLVRSFQLPILQQAPMVTMRIDSLHGTAVTDILARGPGERAAKKLQKINRGLLRWEYRTTYRDSLIATESVVAGKWIGRAEDGRAVVPISFEERAARRLHLTVGDTIVWDVQGVRLRTVIASLRKVDWQRIQANFMVLFPKGVLEMAPKIYILATRAENSEQSGKLQRAVVQAFPNVSVIDLALVLRTLDTFLSKVAFVIRFMALFSIFTGLIVLTSAVLTSRFQRLRESVLLKTLGATRPQVIRINVVEYVFLGGVAAFTGLALAYTAGWGLAYFLFDAVFVPTLWPFFIILGSVVAITVVIGLFNNRGVFNRPPLEILRQEG